MPNRLRIKAESRRCLAVSLAILGLCTGTASGQSQPVVDKKVTSSFSLAKVPSKFRGLANNVGNRFESQNKALQTATGTIEMTSGGKVKSESFVVRYQLPGIFEFQVGSTDIAAFDGKVVKSNSPLSKDLELLSDSIGAASIEGLMTALASGANFRVFANVQINDSRKSNGFNEPCQLVEIADSRSLRSKTETVVRTYCFSLTTGLLRTVFRKDNQDLYETRIDQWTTIGDDTVVTKLSVYQNESLLFRAEYTSVSLTPAVDEAALVTIP